MSETRESGSEEVRENGDVSVFRFAIGPGADKHEADGDRFEGIVLELADDWRDVEIVDTSEKSIGVCEGQLCRIPVSPLAPTVMDDDIHFAGRCTSSKGPHTFTIIVRRTHCRIWTALLGRRIAMPLNRQTEAALLWHGWGRYRELCGLKRFTEGLSGADVLVLRPMLLKTATGSNAGAGGAAGEAGAAVWGSCLLVKSGDSDALKREMSQFQSKLADRLHPFMAKSEVLLDVCPAEPEPHRPHAARSQDDFDDLDDPDSSFVPPPAASKRSTLIGSFLGGDLFEVESFGAAMRGTADAARGIAVVDRLASILAVWHAGSSQRPLAEWTDVFHFVESAKSSAEGSERKLKLFGQFDFRDHNDSDAYALGVGWDWPFYKTGHLPRHLLGKPGREDGLLYRLMKLPVRFSLIHGDLHPSNFLVGGSDVWLLDFGAAGTKPTLYDFAKLEVYLRLWCLDLHPPQANSDDAAHRFEEILLDHMTGSTGGFEAVCELAHDLGAQSPTLYRIAAVVVRIRKLALPYGTGYPDRRDYLAILYLTVLETIQHAAKEPGRVENFRLLMTLCWLLEDTLSRLFGMEPYLRTQIRFDHRALLTPAWIASAGAPERVRYLMDREDGRRALAPLVPTRGVLQSAAHHLDVFDHTLLVLSYVEAMIHDGDPVGGLFDPASLDRKVQRALREEGVRLAPMHGPVPAPASSAPDDPIWAEARARIARHLDDETRLVLKWGALFHDVGKPATRRLSKEGDRSARVDFVGHDLYSRTLATGNLESLFPRVDESDREPVVRRRIAYLIRCHHQHHIWVGRYRREKATVFESMKAAPRLCDVPQLELDHFAKMWEPDVSRRASDFLTLFLHGFADALACRGPELPVSIEETAAIDRVVLRLFVTYMTARERLASKYDDYLDRFRKSLPPDRKPGASIRSWLLRESDKHEVTFEMFCKKAKEAAVRREQ